MSLELSKEMISVQGYLGDAKLLLEQQLGKVPADFWARGIIEIARMLQQERHHLRKKVVDKGVDKVAATHLKANQVVENERRHPKVPPMISAHDDDGQAVEFTTRKTKSIKRLRASDVPRGVDPDDLVKPRKRTPKKAEPKKKARRR